jgi:ABC-type glycerol-3-phosphate transport system substrate-binding protein
MKHRYRILAIALALMLVSPAALAEQDDLAGVITICLYTQPGALEAWGEVEKAYEALHPGVDVVLDFKPSEGYPDWLKATLTEEQPAMDLFYGNLAGNDRIGKVVDFLDYAHDVTPYTGKEWVDQIDFAQQNISADTGWTEVSIEGVQVLWFYNADIFAEVGVEPPTTWDEFAAVCEKIAAAGYQPLAVSGDFDSFWGTQMGWLAQIYTDQTTRDEIEIVRAQPDDYCYNEDIDPNFTYDPTDPHNDDSSKVTHNALRFYQAFRDGMIRCDTYGYKAVWENFQKLFPVYAGGENFFGTSMNGEQTLFYQGKAAIFLSGSWFFSEYFNTMDSIDAGQEVKVGNETVSGLKKFELGTFVMPSMEGPAFQAPARTIEVATGFLDALKKDMDHDALVVDFLQFYTSPQGYGAYLAGAVANKASFGLPLVKDVVVPDFMKSTFANIQYIGNCQKGFGQALARGIGDNQEALRAWYGYSMDYLNGKITIEDWATQHQANQMKYLDAQLAANKINPSDLDTPQNAPSGQ